MTWCKRPGGSLVRRLMDNKADQGKDEFCIPRGKQVINEQDDLFLISPAEDIKQVVELIPRKA